MPKTSTQPLLCRWTSCPHQEIAFETRDELAQHVQSSHVLQFENKDEIVCLWEGCKVYNHLYSRSSITWLESHIRMKHTKVRPHKCLMNGCNMSFNTPDALQRHMLRHFDPSPLPKSPPKKKKRVENVPSKSSEPPVEPPALSDTSSCDKKPCVGSLEGSETSSESSGEGKRTPLLGHQPPKPRLLKSSSFKVKIPRHSLSLSASVPTPLPFNGAHFHPEVLDRRTMSVIRATACQLALAERSLHCSDPSILVTAQVLGKRKRSCHLEDELLIRWKPKLVPDSWILQSQFQQHSLVPFNRLTNKQQSILAQNCFGFTKTSSRRSKRKP